MGSLPARIGTATLALVLALATTAITKVACAQSAAVAVLAGSCLGCHGAEGRGSQAIPPIRAVHGAAGLVAIMQAFRDDSRASTVMGRIARGYTDAEFAALAAYFASDR